MRYLRRFWPVALAAAAAVLVLCTALLRKEEEPAQTTDVTTTLQTQPTVPAQERYAAARSAVQAAENLVLDYTVSESRSIGENTFTKAVTGKASMSRIGAEDMTAVVEEFWDHGVYSCTYQEAYCEGIAYTVVNDCCFRAQITAGEFADRQVPAALLTESLYETVLCQPGADTTLILFSDPVGLEDWVGEAELISASGTATLDGEGNLMQTEYHAEYRTAQVTYQLSITVRVTAPQTLELDAVHLAHDMESTLISDMDTPKRLLEVVADVYATQVIRCDMTEKIDCEALPLTYSQKSTVSVRGFGDELDAGVTYDVTVSDYRGEATGRQQTEQFRDGVFTTAADGGEPVENSQITAEAMREYCEDTVLSGLFAAKYLKDAVCTEEETVWRLEFTGNDSFCGDLMEQLSSFLQVDLDTQAQSMETLRAGGYLTVDKTTGLPVSMGLYFERAHTMDSIRYVLRYTLDQTLKFE